MKGRTREYRREPVASLRSVLREADALYEGRGRLQRTFERLATRLDSMGIAYGLVGAYALILHGVRRFTEDLDLLLKPADLKRLRDELIGKGYRSVRGNSHCLRDAETGVRIDLVLSGAYPGDGKPKPIAFPDPAACLAAGKDIKVVRLTTLIELKLASGMTAPDRLQDLADVQRLIRVHRLRASFARSLHPYVRQTFVDLVRTVSGGAPERRRGSPAQPEPCAWTKP